ncbi:hypothetical protein GQX74_010434 [Glossina fuscipes]|nr:hypothetical protein GQX74_010434 [Glossina fuscipes]
MANDYNCECREKRLSTAIDESADPSENDELQTVSTSWKLLSEENIHDKWRLSMASFGMSNVLIDRQAGKRTLITDSSKEMILFHFTIAAIFSMSTLFCLYQSYFLRSLVLFTKGERSREGRIERDSNLGDTRSCTTLAKDMYMCTSWDFDQKCIRICFDDVHKIIGITEEL